MHNLRQLRATTSSIRAQLFSGENLIVQQAGVGLYDGKDKDDRFQDGTIFLTSHRLIYIDSTRPHNHSCYLDLRLVRKTEFWVGFLKSSPKITLLLGEPSSSSQRNKPNESDELNNNDNSSTNEFLDDQDILNHPATSHWPCQVCGYSNPPSLKCGLCGVPRQSSSRSSPSNLTRRNVGPSSSTSRPSTSHDLHNHHQRSTTEPGSPPSSFKKISRATSLMNLESHGGNVNKDSEDPNGRQVSDSDDKKTIEVACRTCTYLNHPSMSRCEMCDSLLIGSLNLLDPSSDQPNDQNDDQRLNAFVGSILKRPSSSSSTTRISSSLTQPDPSNLSSFQNNQNSYIRLSFRKGGDKAFYESLRNSLQSKHWEKSLTRLAIAKKSRSISNLTLSTSPLSSKNSSNFLNETHKGLENGRNDEGGDDDYGEESFRKVIGIDGILRNMDSSNQADRNELAEGLQDLKALMSKAKEMVQLAKSINTKLTSLENSNSSINNNNETLRPNEQSKELVRSSLIKLGLQSAPITIDMIENNNSGDKVYLEELAKELGGFLNRFLTTNPTIVTGKSSSNGLTENINSKSQSLVLSKSSSNKNNGIILIDEVWCMWNRARGLVPISPNEMLSACEYLPMYTSPEIRLYTFKSTGLKVLHSSRFSIHEFGNRLKKLLYNNNSNHHKSRSNNDDDQNVSREEYDDVEGEDENFCVGGSDFKRFRCMTSLEIAQVEGISVSLTNELINILEGEDKKDELQFKESFKTKQGNFIKVEDESNYDDCKSFDEEEGDERLKKKSGTSFEEEERLVGGGIVVRDFDKRTGSLNWYPNLISQFYHHSLKTCGK